MRTMKTNGDNYFRRGLGLKAQVKPVLAEAYGSRIVHAIKAADYRLAVGRFTFRMARSLGFCFTVGTELYVGAAIKSTWGRWDDFAVAN